MILEGQIVGFDLVVTTVAARRGLGWCAAAATTTTVFAGSGQQLQVAGVYLK